MSKPLSYYGNPVNIKSGVVGQFFSGLKGAAREHGTNIHFYDSSAIPEASYMFRCHHDSVELHQRKEVYAKIGDHTIRFEFHVGIDTDLEEAEKIPEIGLSKSWLVENLPQSIQVYNGRWSQVGAFYVEGNALKHVDKGQVSDNTDSDTNELKKEELPMLIKNLIREFI